MATPAPARTYSAWWVIKLILLILAILCFVVAAFGFDKLGNANLVDLGLAFGFASFLPI
jgi:hypothetical protein